MEYGLIWIFFAGFGTFFTPCVLPLIPVYLGILVGSNRSEDITAARAAGPALGFIAGFSLIFVLLGLSASFIGQALINYKAWFALFGGILILIFGLKFMGLFKFSFLNKDTRYQGSTEKTRFQVVNAFLMGFFFAFGWTPCAGPIIGSVLTWTAVKTNSPLQGAIYLSVFSAGFALPMLLAAIFSRKTQQLFDKIKPSLPAIEKGLGAIMVLVAVMVLIDGAGPLLEKGRIDEQQSVVSQSVESEPSYDATLPTLLEFYSPTCPACRAVAPVMQSLMKECDNNPVNIHMLNLEDSRVQAAAGQAGVQYIPTFIFLDKQGKEVKRLIGYQSATALRSEVAALMGQACGPQNKKEG